MERRPGSKALPPTLPFSWDWVNRKGFPMVPYIGWKRTLPENIRLLDKNIRAKGGHSL